MARHLMAVCVVCLLCAEHLPCKEHFDGSIAATKSNSVEEQKQSVHGYHLETTLDNAILLSSKLNVDDALRIGNVYTKRRGRTKSSPIDENSSNLAKNRIKRHSNHHDDSQLNIEGTPVSKEFMKKLFKQFGDPDGTTMNLLGFEKMLNHLKLDHLFEDRIENDETTIKSSKTSSSNESCISSLEFVKRVSSFDDRFADINHEQKHRNNETNSTNEQNKNRIFLNSNDLYNICPILLYQLTATPSIEGSGCIQSYSIPITEHEKHFLDLMPKESRLIVWMYATISVLGVSLVGLLGVAVIPCMDRHFYQHIIQFLVALAVGTLAGDALLHLLPHAMMSFNSIEDGHASMAWKGLVAVLGIIFFFATERGLTMIAEWRKKIEKKEKPSSRVRVMRDPDTASINNSTAGDKLCKDRYNSYPYCYNEIAMDTKDDHYHHHNQVNAKLNKESLAATPLNSKKNCTFNNTNNDSSSKDTKDHGDHNENAQKLLQSIDLEVDRDKGRVREETYTIILREHESSHHGHSHKHGHVHSPPRSLSAVAWMVVMGDGLHNFTDGMAIGAAFSNNIAGGFSTAIAVFCHELPHELGDFAVLLKAGMSAKQAVYYNLLSSVLSFLGMILGILIGDTPEASAWVFACAAGMFIYIALVDMMPELTSTHNERCALSQCLLQLLGMSCGLGAMLIIALYEDDLKTIFSSHSNYDHLHNR